MQKLFKLAALSIAAMLVIWVVGCGEEENGEGEAPPAVVKSVEPTDGSEVPGNTPITVEFDNPVESCKIAGKDAALEAGNKKAKVDDAGLPEGSQAVTIEWTNKDGSTDSNSATYTVKAPDVQAPTIVSSSPKDGDKDVPPDDVNAGIEIEFDEEVSGTFTLTLEDTPLNWKSSAEGTKIALIPLRGAEVGYEKEYVIEGTVTDMAGNETEVKITFTTQSKE